jgi:hypothetical protein
MEADGRFVAEMGPPRKRLWRNSMVLACGGLIHLELLLQQD